MIDVIGKPASAVRTEGQVAADSMSADAIAFNIGSSQFPENSS